MVKSNLRKEGILGSKRIGSQWYHFINQNNDEPDWTDPKQRLKKASEILGISFADISGQVDFIEKEE